MISRPINLKSHEVLAILRGRKTQMRLPMKPQPSVPVVYFGEISSNHVFDKLEHNDSSYSKSLTFACPYGVIGDRLWIRETLMLQGDKWHYAADMSPVAENHIWQDKDLCPSPQMPQSMGRILLQIKNIRAQKLFDISARDASFEGIEMETASRFDIDEKLTDKFIQTWSSQDKTRHNKDKIKSPLNLWVWVLEFDWWHP